MRVLFDRMKGSRGSQRGLLEGNHLFRRVRQVKVRRSRSSLVSGYESGESLRLLKVLRGGKKRASEGGSRAEGRGKDEEGENEVQR